MRTELCDCHSVAIHHYGTDDDDDDDDDDGEAAATSGTRSTNMECLQYHEDKAHAVDALHKFPTIKNVR